MTQGSLFSGPRPRVLVDRVQSHVIFAVSSGRRLVGAGNARLNGRRGRVTLRRLQSLHRGRVYRLTVIYVAHGVQHRTAMRFRMH